MKVNDIVTISVKVPPLHDDPFWAWNNATQGEGFAWNAAYLNACIRTTYDGSAVVSSLRHIPRVKQSVEGDSSARQPTEL